jgi:hypothetical protein
MKPSTLITTLVLFAILVFFGLSAVAANRAVDREYEYRERHSSSVVSTIEQYNTAVNPSQRSQSGTIINVVVIVLAVTLLFTAVGVTVGKGGLNGLVRQLKSHRRSSQPVHRPAHVPVHTPPALNDYNPIREPATVHALTASETHDDEIQWV